MMEFENSVTMSCLAHFDMSQNEAQTPNVKPLESTEWLTQPARPLSLATESRTPSSNSPQDLLSIEFTSPDQKMDLVYRVFVLPSVMMPFLLSIQVQRLRKLYQLGNVYHRCTGANHTRLEHSIGVAHIAMKMAEHVLNIDPSWRTNTNPMMLNKDICCLGVAGLCHDLGHGPLSHVFEPVVNKIMNMSEPSKKWRHEDMSILLLRDAWREMKAQPKKLYFTDEDIRFIELLITGIAPEDPWPDNVGRDKDKRWLTDIVCNKRNGFDVDKLDYIQRDYAHVFGERLLINQDLIYQSARVLTKDGNKYLAYDRSCCDQLTLIFKTRSQLYSKVYLEKSVLVMDLMIEDAFSAVGPNFKVEHKGQLLTIQKCIEESEYYVHLDDTLIDSIRLNGSEYAKEILNRLLQGNYYPILLDERTDEAHSVEEYRRILEEQVEKPVWERLCQWENEHKTPALVGKIIKYSKVSVDENTGKQKLEDIILFEKKSNDYGSCSFSDDEMDVHIEPFHTDDSSPSRFLLILRAEEFREIFATKEFPSKTKGNFSTNKGENEASKPEKTRKRTHSR